MIKAIITDIEGTTTSISFVKDVLFPHARSHLADFVRKYQNNAEVSDLLIEVATIVGKELSLDEIIAQLLAWSDADLKITPLKSLQGLIWQAGYRNGDFVGHLYDDAVIQLRAWHNKGIKLYIYSSGSVEAQQLLFGHTAHGDLTPLFADYFDTHIGAKKEASSYRNIVETIGMPAENCLFLSDIEAELDAAKTAGLKTYWLVRDSALQDNASHKQIRSFADIELV
jgi:enolase-phosphatase E1